MTDASGTTGQDGGGPGEVHRAARMEVSSLVLKDSHGRVRAELGCSPTGSVSFVLLDAQGEARATIAVGTRGDAVVDVGGPGADRVTVAASPGEGAEVRAGAHEGGRSARMRAEPGWSGLEVADEAGEVRVRASCPDDGSAWVTVLHPDGEPAESLRSDAE